MKTNSLKVRVLIWFGSVVAVILLLFSISFRYFMNRSINHNIKTRLHQEAVDTLTFFKQYRTVPMNQELYASYIVILKNGKLLYNSKNLDLKHITKLMKNQDSFQIYSNEDDDDTISARYIFREKDYITIIYKKDIDNKIENFEDTFLTLDPILFLLLILIASKLIDNILLPINKITKTIQYMSINNFSNIIEIQEAEYEINELVNSFNEMTKRLKNGVENLDRFNNDVSHELKTPLTVIKGELEITLRKLRNPQEYKKSMKIIQYEVNQMQTIIENLLLLTKYSQQNIQTSFEECQLDSMLLETIDKFSTQIKQKNLNLKLKKIEVVSCNANKVLIYSIFSNLIDNALKYTKEEKNIYISLYYKNKQIYFEIQDEGIGIKESKLLKVTERFYRADESRNKSIKGFGLGLSIVQNSINLHNGKLKITSKENVGTIVTVIL